MDEYQLLKQKRDADIAESKRRFAAIFKALAKSKRDDGRVSKDASWYGRIKLIIVVLAIFFMWQGFVQTAIFTAIMYVGFSLDEIAHMLIVIAIRMKDEDDEQTAD